MSSFSSIDVSASGLSAERLRMEVIANNVANANSTTGSNGEPFRRQEVVFASALSDTEAGGGVEVLGIQKDNSDFPKIFKPNHPHADDAGFVRTPNVVIATEMVDLMVASRAYEANLNAIKTYQEMANRTLDLLR